MSSADWEKYRREYGHFVASLEQINGSTLPQLPVFNGSPLNLQRLYQIVEAFGGLARIDAKRTWDDVVKALQIPLPCANAAYAIRQYYLQHLAKYAQERAKEQERDEEESEGAGGNGVDEKRPWTRSQTINVCNRFQTASVRDEDAGGESGVSGGESYRRIVLSLMSGLPNEADFAINVCLLLSADETKPYHLSQTPQLVGILLAHLGIFEEDNYSYRDLYYHGWYQGQSSSFTDFWTHVVKGLSPDDWDSESQCRLTDVETDDIFQIDERPKLDDSIGFRALQVLTILQNFSIDEDNASILSKSKAFMKLLLLCIHGQVTDLRLLALDCFINIADNLVLAPEQSVTASSLLIYTLHSCLLSSDRMMVLKGLEVLAQLCTVDENVENLYRGMDEPTLEAIFSMLLVPDVQLLIAALEALYQLSSHGRRMCEQLLNSIDILIRLMTFDVSSMGKKALTSFKMAEGAKAPPPAPTPSSDRQQTNQVIFLALGNSVSTAPGSPAVPFPIRIVNVNRNSTLLRVSEASFSSPRSRPKSIPHLPVVKVHVNEKDHAKKWLLENYEPKPGASGILRSQLYSDYLGAAALAGVFDLLTVTALSSLVSSAFPESTIERREDCRQQFFVMGIAKTKKEAVRLAKCLPVVAPSAPTTATQPKNSSVNLTSLSNCALETFSTPPPLRRNTTTSVVMTTTKTPVVSPVVCHEGPSPAKKSKLIKDPQALDSDGINRRKPVVGMNGLRKGLAVRPATELQETSKLTDLSNSRPVRAAVNRVVGTPLAVKTSLKTSVLSPQGLIRFVPVSPSFTVGATASASGSAAVGRNASIVSAENILTRTVRFTAALVLRNLARFSPPAKRKLVIYENFIVELASQVSELTSVLAECLYELGHDS